MPSILIRLSTTFMAAAFLLAPTWAAAASESVASGVAQKVERLPSGLHSAFQRVLAREHAGHPRAAGAPVWLEQEVVDADGQAQDNFASDVALSATTAAIGASGKDVNGNVAQGVVYIFTKEAGSWVLSQTLVTDDGKRLDLFGGVLALQGDTLVAGSYVITVNGNLYEGAAYVFNRVNGTWVQSQKLVPDDGGLFTLFSQSLAIDGNTIVVGAGGATINGNAVQGAAYVFTKTNGSWTQTQKLVASDGQAGDALGTRVALDGNVALVAATGASDSSGAVYVFTRKNGTWQQTQKLLSHTAGGYFGASIALEGNTAIIGENGFYAGKEVPGAAYVYTNSGGTWAETQKLVAENGLSGDLFGAEAELDGNTTVIGAKPQVGGFGAAYVFKKSAGSWNQVAKLVAGDGTVANWFGASIGLSKSTVLVGADQADINDNKDQGAAYFYHRFNLGLAASAPDTVGRNKTFVSRTILTNNAASTSLPVVLTVSVPAVASFVSATASQGDCAANDDTVTCRLPGVAGNGGTSSVDVTLKAAAGAGAAMHLTSSVSNATPALGVTATTSINRPPVARDGHLQAPMGKTTQGTLEASDAEGAELTFSIVTQPAHGSVALDDAHKGTYSYTPDAGYAAADSFTFRASDGLAQSNVATVTISIVNQPPVARDGTLSTDQEVAGQSQLQATDPEGNALSFQIVAPPAHGTVQLDATTGAYTYTPASGYHGADAFTFVASDGQSESNVAEVSITVKSSVTPSPDDGGSGGFGGLLLVLLAGLAAAGRMLRGRRRKPGNFSMIHGRRRQTGAKREDGVMRGQGKWAAVTAAVLAVAMIVGTAFSPTSLAAAAMQDKPTGLTGQGIATARSSGFPSDRVVMTPQSSLKLLSRATKLGPHAQHATISLTVGLTLRNVAKLKSFLEQVQNPDSPQYHQWLTPVEFTRLYGPSREDVARVTAFLEQQGITVTDVSANRMLIHTEAPTSAYELAFGIRINDYELNGLRFYSTTNRPKIPRAIAPVVVNLIGLNNGVRLRSHLFQKPLTTARGLQPRQAPAASLTNLNPLQIAHAYNYPDISNASNGAGVNVAILTAMSSGLAGLSAPHDFWAAFGLPDHVINVIPVGGDTGKTDGMGETLLDVEYSGAMGPGATLNVYVAPDASLGSFINMFNHFVNDTNPDGTARNQVMTTSWGAAEIKWGSNAITANQVFMQGAAEGISMFAAAGDWGTADQTTKNNMANFPSSSPFITAANGTQLNISDLQGSYGSEVVWDDPHCFGQGYRATGGAISRMFDKPDWQTGPGVPENINMRMNADMAATASCTKPLMVLKDGTWYLMSGTSAVAPQFAGMFAIAVALHGGPLGQSNKLLYNTVNAGHYATDFHDVTQGCNGELPDGSPSCAAANWDHATGWGSPNVQNLLSHIGISGPKGTLKGVVTGAVTGEPVANARIVAVAADGTDYKARTADDGSYSRLLPAGNLTITVEAVGYTPGTASVTISDGGTTTHDFSLATAEQITLSGTVKDGSSHGYGLYASVKVFMDGFGQVAATWTNPTNGQYSIELPKGATYTVKVAAAFRGYVAASIDLTLNEDSSHDFALDILPTCTAPGYRFVDGGFGEDFNGATFPPQGWTIAPASGTVTWMPSSQQPQYDGNYTSGTGDAASAPGFIFSVDGIPSEPFDTSLVTPAIAVTSLSGIPVLHYKANFQNFTDVVLDVDITTDEGVTWTNLTHWISSKGGLVATPGVSVTLTFADALPAAGTFKLRWRYHATEGGALTYAQIDDVSLGSCVAIPGGLIAGHVTDRVTGESIVGATVADDQGHHGKTLSNAVDPALDGMYVFFSPQGERTVTASAGGYGTATATITVPADQIVRKDFDLGAARFEVESGAFTVHVEAGSSATVSFALKNTGNGSGRFHVLGINAPPPASSAQTPLKRVPIKNPALMKSSISWLRKQANAKGQGFLIRAGTGAQQPRSGGAWQGIASYPVAVIDDFGAIDPATGKVYVLGGTEVAGRRASGAVYDPKTDSWSPMADAPMARMAAAAAFLDGKLYVAGGWTAGDGAAHEVDIYDPATDSWSIGTSSPVGQGGGVAHAVVNGKLYLVGGCNNGACDRNLSVVQVYNPLADTWSTVADYPEPVTFAACAGIDGKLYCAGNVTTVVEGSGYVYDPTTNQWSPIADMPTPQAAAVYAAANGWLLVAGGYDSSVAITNEVLAYDPVTDSWDTSLPRMYRTVMRGAGVCGFYRVGGIIHTDIFGPQATATATVLPGYDQQCGGFAADIPWLTIAPATGTVAVGATAHVVLNLDGSSRQPYTTSKVYLRVLGSTPYPDLTIPLTVTWDPQPVNLSLTGEVTPGSVRPGDTLLYTLTVQNISADGHGAASQVKLSYAVPAEVQFQTASGDAVCAAPAAGSAAASAATDAVTCDFGTIALGDSKTQTLVVKAVDAGKLTGTFEVTAREPDSDTDDNQLTLTSQVIGTADLSLSAGTASIARNGTGELVFTLKNAGPDPASDVRLNAKAGSDVIELESATTPQGHCAVSDNDLTCALGQVNADGNVTVTLEVFGTRGGSTTVNAQASSASNESDTSENSATAVVTVEGTSSDGGGGALGWLALAALLAFAGAGLYARGRRAVR